MNIVKFIPFSKDAELINNYPKPSTFFMPNWYKAMPQFIQNQKEFNINIKNGSSNATAKWCAPLMDSFITGYTLSLDVDIFVTRNEYGFPFFHTNTKKQYVGNQDSLQHEGMPFSNEYFPIIFKWINNWVVELPHGYSVYCSHPANRFDLPFITMNGVIDADNYPNALLFPFLIKKDFTGVIEAGTPIVQLIPFKRENWNSKILKFDEDDVFKRINSFSKYIYRSYKRHFWNKKTFN